jgi:SAM-dependent methyltransferase
MEVRIDPDREQRELRAYLGERYDHSRLENWEQALEDEFDRIGDEAALYRSSEAYLYNLTAFAMSRTKEPYLRDLTDLVEPPARILDYGCGIGSDGLALIEAGYEVAFADFDNPSTRYLRWRLAERDAAAEVYDLDRGPVPGGFDAVFAFDVIEHVEDPFAFLTTMESLAGLVTVNVLEPVPGETALHHELPVDSLIARAAGRRLIRYRRYYERSHLVLYRPEPGGALGGVRSRLALLSGRLRARLG